MRIIARCTFRDKKSDLYELKKRGNKFYWVYKKYGYYSFEHQVIDTANVFLIRRRNKKKMFSVKEEDFNGNLH